MRILFIPRNLVNSGSYDARFKGIDEVTTKFGEAYRLSFVIADGKFKDTLVTGVCSKSTAPSSKFYNWISGISGGKPEPGAEVDIDALVGNLCTVIVEQKENGDAIYSNVTGVIPCQEKEGAVQDDAGSAASAEANPDIPF